MNKTELLLIHELLNQFRDYLSSKGSNDYKILDTPENRHLLEEAEKWNTTNPEEWRDIVAEDGYLYTQDSFLTGYLTYLIKKELQES